MKGPLVGAKPHVYDGDQRRGRYFKANRSSQDGSQDILKAKKMPQKFPTTSQETRLPPFYGGSHFLPSWEVKPRRILRPVTHTNPLDNGG